MEGLREFEKLLRRAVESGCWEAPEDDAG